MIRELLYRVRAGLKYRLRQAADVAYKGQCSGCRRWTCRKVGPLLARRRESAYCDACLDEMIKAQPLPRDWRPR